MSLSDITRDGAAIALANVRYEEADVFARCEFHRARRRFCDESADRCLDYPGIADGALAACFGSSVPVADLDCLFTSFKKRPFRKAGPAIGRSARALRVWHRASGAAQRRPGPSRHPIDGRASARPHRPVEPSQSAAAASELDMAASAPHEGPGVARSGLEGAHDSRPEQNLGRNDRGAWLGPRREIPVGQLAGRDGVDRDRQSMKI
jgi:hypothetical protein